MISSKVSAPSALFPDPLANTVTDHTLLRRSKQHRLVPLIHRHNLVRVFPLLFRCHLGETGSTDAVFNELDICALGRTTSGGRLAVAEDYLGVSSDSDRCTPLIGIT